MPGLAVPRSVKPGEVDEETARRALRRISDYMARNPDGLPEEVQVHVEVGDDDVLVVPRQAVELFAHILTHLAAGRGVTIIANHTMLTTQQAADRLNVSRPYLIKLLEEGEIPYEMVGTHRRIKFEELMAYKQRDDARRRKAVDELTALGQELGGP